MKKVLFIGYSLWKVGGVQSVLVNLMNEIADKYDITVLCLDGYEDFVYELDPKIKTVVLNSFTTRASSINEFIDKYFNKVPKKRNVINYIYQYGVYKLLKEWLKGNHQKYDTIVTTRYMLASMLSTMKEINKKTYAWEHVRYTIGGYFWHSIMRPYYKNLKGVICINTESVEHYKKYNSNTTLIRNIAGQPFEGTEYIPEYEKENVVLFVGRLHPEKNAKELVSIFYQLNNLEDWKLKIIGDGQDRAGIESFIKQSNITTIEVVGNKTKQEVYEYMKKSKILALTSETEGLPTVLIEAMFCSNILVSYDCKYGPANIINERNGFLVPMHDKETFKEKLQLLIDNPILLERLNHTAYQESKNWKKEGIINQWHNILG